MHTTFQKFFICIVLFDITSKCPTILPNNFMHLQALAHNPPINHISADMLWLILFKITQLFLFLKDIFFLV